MKQYKWNGALVWLFLVILSAVEITHMFYALNPQLDMDTFSFLILFLKVMTLFSLIMLPLLIFLVFYPGFLPAGWIAIPLLLTFGFYYHQHKLHSFLDEGMAKIFMKESHALAFFLILSLLLVFALKKETIKVIFLAFLMLVCVHFFQYNRRDNWTIRRPSVQSYPVPLEISTRTVIILTSGLRFEELVNSVQERKLPALTQIYEESARGRLLRQKPEIEPSKWVSLYTGVYPYQHRVFGTTRRMDPFFPKVDLFPWLWIHGFGATRQPLTTSMWQRPALWDVGVQSSRSCALFKLPYVEPAPANVTRAVTGRDRYPCESHVETNVGEFVRNTPTSILMVYTEAGERGETLDRLLSVCIETLSDYDVIMVVDPLEGRWVLLWGSIVAGGEVMTEASIVDLFPTILYVQRLPIPRYADGRILLDGFTRDFQERHPIMVISGGL